MSLSQNYFYMVIIQFITCLIPFQEQFQKEIVEAEDNSQFSVCQAEKSATKSAVMENQLDIKVGELCFDQDLNLITACLEYWFSLVCFNFLACSLVYEIVISNLVAIYIAPKVVVFFMDFLLYCFCNQFSYLTVVTNWF